MDEVKLYLDENITPVLASVLRGKGYDVISAHEVGMRGKKDLAAKLSMNVFARWIA